jgi:cyclopropane-fatty-acyl-phospholipid synthase
VLDALFGPAEERTFAIRLWNGLTEVPAHGRPAFTLVFSRPGALRRMLLPLSELSLIEGYLSGDVDIEGSIEAAAEIPITVARHVGSVGQYVRLLPLIGTLPSDHDAPAEPTHQARRLWQHGKQHTATRDARAIQFHYDVSNEFYALWLDQRMVYSCAYFEDGVNDLDTAQAAKLNHICRKLRLAPGERLLDIGCGWGGLIQYAAEQYGADAVGITLSEAQAAEARARIASAGLFTQCRVDVRDYRVPTDAPLFDKISSVGMIEHVGRNQLPAYFAAAYRALKPGGLFLNHGIVTLHGARPSSLARRLKGALWREGAFIDRYVFPDGHLVPLADVIAAAEAAGFETRDAENLREHYAKTLRHWVSRLEARAEDAIRLVGDPTYRVWRLYMSASAHAFDTASIGIVQTLFAKPDARGRSHVPPTRRDLYYSTKSSRPSESNSAISTPASSATAASTP